MIHHDAQEQLSDPKYRYLFHSTANDYMGAGKRRPGRPKVSRKKVEAAIRETFTNVPSTVKRANVSPERKRQMKIAIGFAKARKR